MVKPKIEGRKSETLNKDKKENGKLKSRETLQDKGGIIVKQDPCSQTVLFHFLL